MCRRERASDEARKNEGGSKETRRRDNRERIVVLFVYRPPWRLGRETAHREEGELLLQGQLAVAAVAHPQQHANELSLVLLCAERTSERHGSRRHDSRFRSESVSVRYKSIAKPRISRKREEEGEGGGEG